MPKVKLVQQQKDAAALLGVTATALRKWMSEAGFPDCSSGFDIEAIRAWQQQRRRKGSEAADNERDASLRLKEAKAKVEAAKAELMELKLRTAAGELLPRLGWDNFAATLLTNLGEMCEQLPELVAGDCCKDCAVKVSERLKTELDQWRQDVRDDLEHGPAEKTGK